MMLKERLKVHTVLWRKVHQPFQTDQQKSGFPLMKFQEINYIKHIVLIVLWNLLRQKKSYFKKKKTNSMAFISTPDMEYWTNSSGI